MIELKPAIILNYPLHWFPLLVEIMESQGQFHQTNLEPGFSSSLCGVEEMCYSTWRREERGAETHLISSSSWPTWPHWMVTENYSVTKISWLKPEPYHWSEIKPCSVILIPGVFPVVCCTIETNWKYVLGQININKLMNCTKIGPGGAHSERKYCQNWK